MDTTQKAVINWLANGETGLSSETMAFWLAFDVKKEDGSHPHDPDDMDRCLNLLSVAPGLRDRLPKMAELNKTWAALVARWNEIESMQMDEIGLGWTKAMSAPKTYALMKEVINGARNQSA